MCLGEGGSHHFECAPYVNKKIKKYTRARNIEIKKSKITYERVTYRNFQKLGEKRKNASSKVALSTCERAPYGARRSCTCISTPSGRETQTHTDTHTDIDTDTDTDADTDADTDTGYVTPLSSRQHRLRD